SLIFSSFLFYLNTPQLGACPRNKARLLGWSFITKKSRFSEAKYHFSGKNSEKCEYSDRLK
ncbi:MAG: hypothetical protein KAU84_01010, partial [Thermoplasmatales archaeon]|nr:hypothetical protein [Thermoplasmatales archaeon]